MTSISSVNSQVALAEAQAKLAADQAAKAAAAIIQSDQAAVAEAQKAETPSPQSAGLVNVIA
jgi:hypothetical protein